MAENDAQTPEPSVEEILRTTIGLLRAADSPNHSKAARVIENSLAAARTGLDVLGGAAFDPGPTLIVEVPAGSRIKVEAR